MIELRINLNKYFPSALVNAFIDGILLNDENSMDDNNPLEYGYFFTLISLEDDESFSFYFNNHLNTSVRLKFTEALTEDYFLVLI